MRKYALFFGDPLPLCCHVINPTGTFMSSLGLATSCTECREHATTNGYDYALKCSCVLILLQIWGDWFWRMCVSSWILPWDRGCVFLHRMSWGMVHNWQNWDLIFWQKERILDNSRYVNFSDRLPTSVYHFALCNLFISTGRQMWSREFGTWSRWWVGDLMGTSVLTFPF